MYSKEEIISYLKDYEKCVEKLYLAFMQEKCECGHCGIESFSSLMSLITQDCIAKLHEKYVDHLEGRKLKG